MSNMISNGNINDYGPAMVLSGVVALMAESNHEAKLQEELVEAYR